MANGADLNAYYGFSSDGSTLVNQTRDERLITFRREGDRYEQVASLAFPHALSDIRLSPKGTSSCSGSRAGPATRCTAGSGQLGRVRPDRRLAERHQRLRGRRAVRRAGHRGQEFTVWDLTGEPERLADVETEESEVPAAFAGAPGMLAVGDLAGEITVYSLQDPAGSRVTARLREARSSISQVNFSADGGRLFASTYEGLVWVWRLDGSDPELELRLEPGAQAVQGSPSWTARW
ncbi:hypothetical protein G7085_13360 [Tessaracoccus sp. HDW20]|uniref:hypothetical protein n=1 Tax=Tessaracoccus coleopterorum TaxID=2714950 RepID=UPI0018D42D9E|nr:hypothetical protein [Tessaracoccus coleopterorum]NHB85287.1 hypothetical protein [Tessaracoccus coleopterorum]